MVQFRMFLAFVAKNGPKIVKNCQKGQKMGMNKWPISEKTYPPNCLKLGQNTILGPIIMIIKVSACIWIKISQGGKIDIFGPSYSPTGIKGPTDQMLP